MSACEKKDERQVQERDRQQQDKTAKNRTIRRAHADEWKAYGRKPLDHADIHKVQPMLLHTQQRKTHGQQGTTPEAPTDTKGRETDTPRQASGARGTSGETPQLHHDDIESRTSQVKQMHQTLH